MRNSISEIKKKKENIQQILYLHDIILKLSCKTLKTLMYVYIMIQNHKILVFLIKMYVYVCGKIIFI